MMQPQDPAPEAWAAVFARMAGMVMSEQTVTTVLELITSLARDTLAGSVGAGITLVDEAGNRSTSAATGQVVSVSMCCSTRSARGPA